MFRFYLQAPLSLFLVYTLYNAVNELKFVKTDVADLSHCRMHIAYFCANSKDTNMPKIIILKRAWWGLKNWSNVRGPSL